MRTSTVEWPYVSADLELLSVRIVALRLLLHFQVFSLEPLPPPYLIILLSVCAIGRLCAASGWNQNHVKCLDVAMFFFFGVVVLIEMSDCTGYVSASNKMTRLISRF